MILKWPGWLEIHIHTYRSKKITKYKDILYMHYIKVTWIYIHKNSEIVRQGQSKNRITSQQSYWEWSLVSVREQRAVTEAPKDKQCILNLLVEQESPVQVWQQVPLRGI